MCLVNTPPKSTRMKVSCPVSANRRQQCRAPSLLTVHFCYLLGERDSAGQPALSAKIGSMFWQLTKLPNLAGNLVDMGKLAFAPATPEVLQLAAHLRRSHELFADVFHGVFRCCFSAYISLIASLQWSQCSVSLRIHRQYHAIAVGALGNAHARCVCVPVICFEFTACEEWYRYVANACLTNVLVCMRRTESDAEEFVSSETERLWALVVFNSGPSAAGSGA